MYPMMISLKNKKITIIGGGKVAFRKTQNFLDFEHGVVEVISPVFLESFKEIKHSVRLIKDSYKEQYIQDSFIVVAATDDHEVNLAIGTYCEKDNKLCNVVDHKALSSFIVPSYIKRGDLVISVSTNGTSPFLASKIRKDLEMQYGIEYINYTKMLGRLRKAIIKGIVHEEEKKKALEHLTSLSLNELVAYEKEIAKG